MDILCSDCYGTLTFNKPLVNEEFIKDFHPEYSKKDVLLFAALASKTENTDSFDDSLLETFASSISGFIQDSFIHFNPKMDISTYYDDVYMW